MSQKRNEQKTHAPTPSPDGQSQKRRGPAFADLIAEQQELRQIARDMERANKNGLLSRFFRTSTG